MVLLTRVSAGSGMCRCSIRSLLFSFQTEVFAHVPSDKPTPNKLFIVISSDKGLCGGIHSSVSKATRRALSNAPDSPLAGASANDATVDASSPIMVIGDKSKAQLSRALPSNLQLTFNQIGRDIPTFADAAGVADLIIKSGVKYDSVVLVYNKFLNNISYEASTVEVKGEEALKESSAFDFLKLKYAPPEEVDSFLF
jgi:F-type H+-transporting ATPase subunit gamma